MDHTDQSLGKIIEQLKQQNLYSSTVVIITAKHGQSPIDPAKTKIVNKKSVHEIETILQEAVAKKKEENSNIQQMQQTIESLQAELKKAQADNARLVNNASQQSKEKLALEAQVARDNTRLRERELDIMEDKNKATNKIAEKDIVLKSAVVELEKEQLIFSDGKETEVNNNLI